MMVDLATCEWNPGINRSIVSIETAAKRVRPEDRSLIVSQFNAKSYNDVVEIRKNSITGTAQYSAVIRNMNFGTGRVCKVITRSKWKQKDVVSAIVFWINGRSYGYASACGNLFELDMVRSPPTVPPPVEVFEQTYDHPQTIGEPFGPIFRSESESPYSPIQSSSFGASSFDELASVGYGGGFYYGGGVGVIPYVPSQYFDGPSAPIPELPVWSYLGISFAFVGLLNRRKKNGSTN